MAKTKSRKKPQIKQNPKIVTKDLAGGRTALYLEFYGKREQSPKLDSDGNQMYYTTGKMAGKPMFIVRHDRWKENLKLRIVTHPKTQEERESNSETWRLAEAVRARREEALLNEEMGYNLNRHKTENIIAYFESYLANYTKKDYRNIALAINRFKTFLRDYRPNAATKRTKAEIDRINADWEERHRGINGRHELNENVYYRFTLKPNQLKQKMVIDFKDYLLANSEGSGAATAFKRFKKIVKAAVEDGVLISNPCEDITCPEDEGFKKDILSPEEITALARTHYPGENPEIRLAFILTLYTGIRFCDVKELTFGNIDYGNSMLKFTQAKTTGHSSKSEVEIPLRQDLLQMIGRPEDHGKLKTDKIFDLPSHTMCLKALGRWTAKAGIDKHITWHCGRHSFATLILTNGADAVTTARLLGHSNLKYVEVYVRALDKQKQKAVNSLPALDI